MDSAVPVSGPPTRRRTLEHYLAPIGRTEFDIFAESAVIHDALESELHYRLGRSPQLGIVSEAWPAARHTKLEYVCLMLFLISHCKNDTSIPLNTRVKLEGGDFSSGASLLSAWSMLLQVGHLHWTFFAERELLEQIVSEPKRIDELLAGLPDEVQGWATRVLQERDFYRFHQILAIYRAMRMQKQDGCRELALRALTSYVLPAKRPALTRLQRLYRSLRRVAFLVLDAEYSPTTLSVQLDRLLRDKPAFERIVVGRVSGAPDELASLESHLIRAVYMGERAVLKSAQWRPAIRHVVRSRLGEGVASAIGSLKNRECVKAKDQYRSLDVTCRMEFEFLFLSPDLLDPSLSVNHLRSRDGLSGGGRCSLEYVWGPKRRFGVAQFHSAIGNAAGSADALGCALSLLAHFTDSVLQQFPGPQMRQFVQQALAPAVEQLVLSSLRAVFGARFRWEFLGDVGGVVAVPASSQALMDAFCDPAIIKRMKRSRRHELLATQAVAKSLAAGNKVMSVVSLAGYPHGDLSPLVEVDGVIVAYSQAKKRLSVVLVEAKFQNSGAEAAAKRALTEKNSKLGLVVGVSRSRRFSRAFDASSAAFAWNHYTLARC